MTAPRDIARSYGKVVEHPPIVLLPGLGIIRYLLPLVRRVVTWTEITVLDLPGWSVRHRRNCRPDVGEIGRVAARWLEAQDRRDVLLLGHSTGSQAALHAAALVPDRLSGLVLASPVFAPPLRRSRQLAGAIARTLPHEQWAELPAVLPASLASRLVPLARLLRSGMNEDPEVLARVLSVPASVITGSEDAVSPTDWSAQLAEACGGDCYVHPGGHNACFVDPEGVEHALEQAVESCLRHRDGSRRSGPGRQDGPG